MVDGGVDIDVKASVSLIADLRVGDERSPFAIMVAVMKQVKRKNGESINLEGLQVPPGRSWPPTLKAIRIIAEAVVHKHIRSQGSKAIAVNAAIALATRNAAATMRAVSVASSVRRERRTRSRSESAQNSRRLRRRSANVAEMERDGNGAHGAGVTPRRRRSRSPPSGSVASGGQPQCQSEAESLAPKQSIKDLDPATYVQYALDASNKDGVKALRLLRQELRDASDLEVYLLAGATNLDSSSVTKAAACRGLLYILEKNTELGDLIPAYVQHEGNMLRVLESMPVALGQLLVRFPTVAQAFPTWSAASPSVDTTKSKDNIGASVDAPMSGTEESAALRSESHRSGQQQNAGPSSHLPPPPPPPLPSGVDVAVLPKGGKPRDQIRFEDYVDLRISNGPHDPAECMKTLAWLQANPRSPASCPVYKFACDPNLSPRLRRWLYWKALAEVGIFVHELYAFTDHDGWVNARAVGNDGCEGVQMSITREVYGTVNWYTEDRRLDSPNGNREMWRRMQQGFVPWNPETDLGKYSSVPKQITNAFGPLPGRVRNPLFRV